jgi:glucose-1-phosphate adenylyltransferase
MITEGCSIAGEVDYSVLFARVKVEEGAVVDSSIVMPGTVIKKGAVVQYAIVAENAVIEPGAVVGEKPENTLNRDEWGVAVVGAGVKVGQGAKVAPKEMVGEDVPAVNAEEEEK